MPDAICAAGLMLPLGEETLPPTIRAVIYFVALGTNLNSHMAPVEAPVSCKLGNCAFAYRNQIV